MKGRNGRMPAKKILFIGLDGASWRLVNKLAEAGELPNIARLKQEGASGLLKSIEPPISPSIWTSISSGKLPDKHGIKDFISTSEAVRCKRLWDILEQRGMTVGLCGHMVTWPPRAIKGFIIPSPFAQGPETYPEELSFIRRLAMGEKMKKKRSLKAYARYARTSLKHGISTGAIVSAAATLVGNKLGKRGFLDKFFRERFLKFRMYTELFIHLCRRYGPELMVFCDNTTDSLAHNYWKFMEPEKFDAVPEEDVRKFGDVIPEAYRRADAAVGQLLSLMDDDTTAIVVSDHGFKADSSLTIGNPYTIKTESLLKSIRATERLRGTNIASRVLLRDKHDDGAFLDEVMAKLSAITIKETGDRLLRLRTEWLPHIVVSLNLNHMDLEGLHAVFPDGSEHRLDEVVEISDSRMSGEHDVDDGVLFVLGRNVRKGASLSGAHVTDVTPTMLALAGMPVAEDMDGKVLTDAMEPEFLADHPVSYVPTYEDEESSGVRNDDGRLTEDLKEQLRNLGYLS